MLKIAACDDEVIGLHQLETLIREYDIKHPELELSFVSFQSSEELLAHVKKNAFHIYLLDIIMDGRDGIGIGAAIREVDSKAVIIYTTVSPDYAVQSYTVDAFYYLLKPIDGQHLFPVLDKAAKQFTVKHNSCFSVKTRDKVCSVKSSSVMYIEYHSHRMSYHLEDGTILDSISFRESFEQASMMILKNRLFAKVSSSFIVNFAQVEKVTKKGFCIKDGTEITVSRLYSDVKKEYMGYILRGGNLYDI